MGLDGSQDTPALNSPGPPPSGTDTLVEVAEAHREMAGATSNTCQYQRCPGPGLHLACRAKGPAERRQLNQIPSHPPETCLQFLRARCKTACP